MSDRVSVWVPRGHHSQIKQPYIIYLSSSLSLSLSLALLTNANRFASLLIAAGNQRSLRAAQGATFAATVAGATRRSAASGS